MTVSTSILLASALMILPVIPALMDIFRWRGEGSSRTLEETIHEGGDAPSDPESSPEHSDAPGRTRDSSGIFRIVGDISIPDGTEIREPVVVHGSMKIGKRCRLHATIRSSGRIEVGEKTVIEGDMHADGEVTLGSDATVKGVIYSAEDIILKEGAVAEAVSTRKSVKMSPGARVYMEIQPRTLRPTVFPASEEAGAIASKLGRLDISSKEEETPAAQTFAGEREDGEPSVGKKPAEPDLTETEARVLRLVSSERDADDIGLMVLLDPMQVQEVIRQLVGKKCLAEGRKPSRRKIVEEEARLQQPEEPSTKPMEEKAKDESPSMVEIFENLLAAKMRDEVKRKATAQEESSH